MPNSSDPYVQASVNIFNTVGLIAGVRALPVFSLSRLRLNSAANRDWSTSKCRRIAVKSAPVSLSNLVRKCSTSIS